MTEPVRRKSPTLRSIAAFLGVDISTVSRVLNGSQAEGLRAASPETAERIRAYALEVHYRPNPNAIGLRTQRTSLIAVIVPRLSDGVIAQLVEGIEEEARLSGFTAFAMSTHDDPVAQADRIRAALGRRVDGIVVTDARLDADLPAELIDSGTPFVLANRRIDGQPAVTADERLGGQLAAAHLLKTGRRRFAVIAGPSYASTAVERTAGFVETIRGNGVHIPEHRIVECGFDIDSGRQAMRTILQTDAEVDAVFAVDDYAAIGAARVARDARRRVGGDLALVGYNDTSIAAELDVALSSVGHPTSEIGRQAMRSLASTIAGAPPVDHVLAPRLMIRASSE